MAIFALNNAVIYAGTNDLTGVSNKLSAQTSVAELDVTTFGNSGYLSRIGGLQDVQFTVSGFADFADTIDANTISNLGGNTVITFGPTGADVSTAYFFQALQSSYKPLDNAVGDAAGYELTASNAYGTAATVPGLVRGAFLLPKSTKTSTGTGTVNQLGAVSATQRVYAACHVFTAGSTATVKVQSSATAGGTYADRVTFTNPTAGATVSNATGAITDTYWRVNITAISGTYVLAVAVGIR